MEKNMLYIGGAAAAFMYLYYRNNSPSKEINWQMFRTQYLEKGEVEHIEISNKSVAKVYLKGNPSEVIEFIFATCKSGCESFKISLKFCVI